VVQVGLSQLVAQEDVMHYGILMAGVLVAIIPPLLVFMALQEAFVRGFQFGGDK
jgi:sn-glycerol 3-phosphate transport system permease protein